MTSPPMPPDGMTPYPRGPEAAVSAVEQPTSIVRAVLLMRVGAGLSVLNLVVALLTLSSIKGNIRQQLVNSHDYTPSRLDNAYHVAIVAAVVSAVIGVALWLWMAWANGNGRRWARTVATVLGAFSILAFIIVVGQGQETALGLVLTAITAVLAIAILVLLWQSESSAFYRAHSRSAGT